MVKSEGFVGGLLLKWGLLVNKTLIHKMEYGLMFIASSGLAITLIYYVCHGLVDVDKACVCTYLYSKLKPTKFTELTFSPSHSIFITTSTHPHMHCVTSQGSPVLASSSQNENFDQVWYTVLFHNLSDWPSYTDWPHPHLKIWDVFKNTVRQFDQSGTNQRETINTVKGVPWCNWNLVGSSNL